MNSEIIVDDDAFDIRYTVMGDLAPLKEWLYCPDIVKWFPFEGVKEIDLMANNWIGFSRYKCSLTATYDKKPVGVGTLFLMPYRKLVHLSVVYLVIDPEMQGRGVATSLVRNIKNLGKTTFRLRSVHFELMQDSPLLPILKKQDFQEIIQQDNFYKRNGESVGRVVMESVL